jgi:hypothetical protein
VDRKGKIGGTWFSPLSYIRRERDFKDHNRMSEPSSMADKKCTTSKKGEAISITFHDGRKSNRWI